MDELGKSFPMAEGLVDAEEGSKLKPNNEFCLNCGTKLIDTFCHHCGQKDIPKRQTLGELLTNFISSFWSYEGKFFTTVKFLVVRPGFLATEYNAGRRESYYHPARMYVFISFVFFLLLFSLPDSDSSDTEKDKQEMTKNNLKEMKEGLKEAGLDSASRDSIRTAISKLVSDSIKIDVSNDKDLKKKKKGGVSFMGKNYTSSKQYDSAQNALSENKRDGWFVQKLNRRTAELNERYRDSDKSFNDDFSKAFLDNFSKVLFYLLPIFALLLRLLYVRRDFFYSEHLVFSIYYYNFFYLAASLQLIVNLLPALDWVSTVIGFWIFFYLLFAMKRMYGQSWKKTILKFSLFSFTFMCFLGIGLAISAITVLLMI